ncbi:MAG: hypothetical protein ACOH2A_11800 [Sphingobacteriaceae bacterium]
MSIICKAAIAYCNGRYGIENIPDSDLQEDVVLVKIQALCYTDHDSLNWGKQ